MECRSGYRTAKKKGFLREHGRCIRASQRIALPESAALESNRAHTLAGLAAFDEAPAKRGHNGSLEQKVACERLAGDNCRKSNICGKAVTILVEAAGNSAFPLLRAVAWTLGFELMVS